VSRQAQLVQARVRQFHLGLDTHRTGDGHLRSGLSQEVEKRRLADARLAAQHQ